ncbi:MAG TPA: hypothetical protein VFP65_20675 [Anaeromyxobacteraceae bacterium]|nr:hypothetical protein [Anaeromyxobacteraceae bacterium]
MAPAVRARHMKTVLAAVDALAPEQAPAVRERFGAAALRAVEDASAVEWLDLGLNLSLTRAIEEVLGRAGCHRLFRSQLDEALQTPVFRAIVDGAIALFGLDPSSWARFIPSGWGLVFREVGRWSVEHNAPGELQLALADLPPATVVDDVWPASVAASLGALVGLARAEGGVQLAAMDRGRRLARYTLAWTPRARR